MLLRKRQIPGQVQFHRSQRKVIFRAFCVMHVPYGGAFPGIAL
jgi:hypothetical protein